MEFCYNAYISGEDINFIYTDYEEAFDKVDHGLLLQNLHNTGIKGKILKIIKSYLNGGSQRNRIQDCFDNDCFDNEKPVSSGVPQGTMVACLLFIICINDLPDLCKSLFPLLCADDAKIITINKRNIAVQIELSRVKEWSKYYGLPLNTLKCHNLFLSSSNTEYCIAKSPILKIDGQRDLTILVSKDLKWDHHIEMACSETHGIFFMLQRSSPKT